MNLTTNRTMIPRAFFSIAIACGLATMASPSPTQEGPSPEAAAKRAAIDKVAFLVGQWDGEGWMATGPGARRTFKSWERVEPRLGGQLLVLEGRHESLEEGQVGKIVHEAFAVLSWDDKAHHYQFRSHTAAGLAGDFEGRVEGGAFIWTLPLPSGQIHYTIRLDSQGRWVETGERSTDGATWSPFFSMTLAKRR